MPDSPGRMLAMTPCRRSGNASKQRRVCGRGPTTLMSPLKMFTSCGSSLIFVLRRKRPSGSTLGSSFTVKTPVPMFGLFFSIVANFQSLNGLPRRPTRSWRYRTSPSPEKRSARATNKRIGNRAKMARPEKKISSSRVISTSVAGLNGSADDGEGCPHRPSMRDRNSARGTSASAWMRSA